MTEDDIELRILRGYVKQHKAAEMADLDSSNKCARELDMREVLAKITGESGADLEYATRLWHGQLAPEFRPYQSSQAPLIRCSDSRINNTQHRYHARAFTNAGKAPAWDRIRELEARQPPQVERELEQKFGILYSPAQERRDFDAWTSEAIAIQSYAVGVIFVDVDDFKQLNKTFTESVIDRTIFPELQQLVRGLVLHRGAAYRHGGEELVVLLPNCLLNEAEAFAYRIRDQIAGRRFEIQGQRVQVTVSIGVAVWPENGSTLDAVIEKANHAEHEAKLGKNRVCCTPRERHGGSDVR